MSKLLAAAERPHNRALILLIAILLLLGGAIGANALGRTSGLSKERVTLASVSGQAFAYDMGKYPELDKVHDEYVRLAKIHHPDAEAKYQEMMDLMRKLGVMEDAMENTTLEFSEEKR